METKRKQPQHAPSISSHETHAILPNIFIDCVIVGFDVNQLKVLLLQCSDTKEWRLPSGPIYQEEPINSAALRISKAHTGLPQIHLHQFHAFGDPKMKRKEATAMNQHGTDIRFITIAYLALVDISKVVMADGPAFIKSQWWSMSAMPKLTPEQKQILPAAIRSLREHSNDYPVEKELLAEKFTMADLHRLYQAIYAKDIDRRNFQKKMLSLSVLERLKEKKTGRAHKAAFLYKFDAKKFHSATAIKNRLKLV